MAADENLVTLDIGTSSVRTLLFNPQFESVPNLGRQEKYQFLTRPDGSVEVDPQVILNLTCQCLDTLHQQMQERSLKAAGVAISTFWHCFLGLDQNNTPTTPIVHLFDTRSGRQMEELTHHFEATWLHAITGCMPHTSYWPAKLLWLKEDRPDDFARTRRWISVGEFLIFSLTGKYAESMSMVSASGIWEQRNNRYCAEVLDFIGLQASQLAPVETLDQPVASLKSEYASRWPLFHGILWYPAYGDGACNSIGSGCTTPDQFALMVGTSGALRVVVKQPHVATPSGIWCYRVNRERFILGGAISNGGEVFRWITRTLKLPDNPEDLIAGRKPGSHGLTMLPYFAGERSPYWRPDLRAAISGMSLATEPLDILQACLESVALRFRQIYQILTRPFPQPAHVIASGGALVQSKVWLKMMSDALGHPIVASTVREASSRGAALIAAEQMKLTASLEAHSPAIGSTIEPEFANTCLFDEMLARDQRLFAALYGHHSPFDPPENTPPLGSTSAPFSSA